MARVAPSGISSSKFLPSLLSRNEGHADTNVHSMCVPREESIAVLYGAVVGALARSRTVPFCTIPNATNGASERDEVSAEALSTVGPNDEVLPLGGDAGGCVTILSVYDMWLRIQKSYIHLQKSVGGIVITLRYHHIPPSHCYVPSLRYCPSLSHRPSLSRHPSLTQSLGHDCG